jgi:hypothetical protein
VISSAAAHQLLPGRIEVDLGNGTSDFIEYAPYVWRANLLGYVIRAYGMACVRVLDMVNPGNASRLNDKIIELLGDQRMRDAESELLDKQAIAFMDARLGNKDWGGEDFNARHRAVNRSAWAVERARRSSAKAQLEAACGGGSNNWDNRDREL